MPTTRTTTCPICAAEMRIDYFGRHMATHDREILKRDPDMRVECIDERCPVVAFRSFAIEPSGARRFITKSAHCLVCGAHDYCHATVWRFVHAQWCEDCRAPFNGECSCGRKSRKQANTAPNKCDDFITKHTETCGARWDSVADWFDLKKPAPKKCVVANRKTDRKREAPPAKRDVVETPLSPLPEAPAKSGPSGPSDDAIREAVIAAFPTLFDEDWREWDDDLDEHETWREMLTSANTSLEERTKRLDKMQDHINAQVESRIAKTMATTKREHNAEIAHVERERIAETERANKLQHELESAVSELRTRDREFGRLRAQLARLQQLCDDNGIETDE